MSFQLTGVGARTKGLTHHLVPGQAVVIGRDPGCTLVITRDSMVDAEAGFVSRHHVVVDSTGEDGWWVYDNNSLNGTAVLKEGVPPVLSLDPGVRHALAHGDVIELAATAELQFAYFESARDPLTTAADDEPTRRVLVSSQAALQRLSAGQTVGVYDLSRGECFISVRDGSLWWGAVATDNVVARVVAAGQRVVLHSISSGAALNLRSSEPGSSVVLRDKDLLTFDHVEGVAILFLDPEAVLPRALSDLLGDADRISIGTGPDNACRIIDPSLSRQHALVWRNDGQLQVRDLGSLNGTTVDGVRVHDQQLLPLGSTLTLGRVPISVDARCWSPPQSAPGSIDVRLLRVFVEIAGKLRLRDVSLGVRQGEMVGVVGPSASGKSTLLKVVAGQQRVVSGEIYLNGRALANENRWTWFKSLLGYRGEGHQVGFVHQQDVLPPELTVREILDYAAREMGFNAEAARVRAHDAGAACNLGALMDRVVRHGTGQLNLSGGQLKRVCVAIEVLRQPRILVLDEPTTGQDPRNADEQMNLFRSLAQDGVTLLISTHDLRNLALFDRVVALCLGHLVYCGPPAFFASHFGESSPAAVYASLPDKEDRLMEAERLAAAFRATRFHREYCEVPE